LARLLAGLDIPKAATATVRQVHGGDVAPLRLDRPYGESLSMMIRNRFHGQTPADAMLSDISSVVLAVRIADCVPILLATDDGLIVAAIHAGWRGVLAEVAAHTIAEINAMGFPSARIIAAIGPAIGVEHFEVRPEAAGLFHSASLSDLVHTVGEAKPHLDLAGAIKLQLRQCGITRIDGGDLCTYANAGDFFSHRRDHGLTGRMAAIIRPASP
ncbi:MAG: peptidoglycan editing factor PgeF, partial [Phycisphaerae bacterium]